ncbi:hypothetical protein C7453_102383 [Gluconacetobacter liquefaciens]|uniref:Uncharacterized protein n=1 Tax=Gluconacetobacter liquefaciens TaxID=89584 RepID=A0A370G9C0_GLULI|nr:hypothetical protein C7453_102383 [Gluconacetobacter liquefaciens]
MKSRLGLQKRGLVLLGFTKRRITFGNIRLMLNAQTLNSALQFVNVLRVNLSCIFLCFSQCELSCKLIALGIYHYTLGLKLITLDLYHFALGGEHFAHLSLERPHGRRRKRQIVQLRYWHVMADVMGEVRHGAFITGNQPTIRTRLRGFKLLDYNNRIIESNTGDLSPCHIQVRKILCICLLRIRLEVIHVQSISQRLEIFHGGPRLAEPPLRRTRSNCSVRLRPHRCHLPQDAGNRPQSWR